MVLAKARMEGRVPSKDLGFWLQAYSVVDYQCSWIFHGEQSTELPQSVS